MATWFERLTGFAESGWEATRARLAVNGDRLVSTANGRSWAIGTLETPSLAELRRRAAAPAGAGGAGPRVRNLSADARLLHAAPEAAGALVQVASQFNLLEMSGPQLTPENGVTIYANDHTQGPACALAAAPATLYRNYFAETGQGSGQTRERQIDTLKDLARELVPGGIRMRNGYALPSIEALRAINARLGASDPEELERLRGLLRIGLHRDVEVVEPGPGCGQLLSQAFCSALPVSYGGIGAGECEPFARLVLEAAYEATLLAAVENAARGRSNTVFLTLLGGGVFGNDRRWILDALRRALDRVRGHDLDVCVVSHGRVPQDLEQLAADYGGTGPAATVVRRLPARPAAAPAAAGRAAFDHAGDIDPRPHGNCYWLARGRILAGEYPRTPHRDSSRARLEALLDAGVRRFVDLTETGEGLAPYHEMLADRAAARQVVVHHQRHAIRDLGVPSQESMRRILDVLLAPHEGITYVHCWGGVGRTGTVAACLLVEAGFSAEEALALLGRKWLAMDKRGRRPQSPETAAQADFVRQWIPARR